MRSNKKIAYLIAISCLFLGGISTAMAAETISYGGFDYNIVNGTTLVAPDGADIGNVNLATGDISVMGGGAFNLAKLRGAVITATTESGGAVSTIMDGHSYGYQSAMFNAGVAFVDAFMKNNDAAQKAAMDAANAALVAESGGTQQKVVIRANADGSLSYGCINSQNTTLRLPPLGTKASTPAPDVAPAPVVLPPPPPPAPSVSVTAPSVVEIPDPLRVSWFSSNANTCWGSGEWNISGLSGSKTIWAPTATAQRGSHIFSATCSGPGGTASGSASARVIQVPRCTFAANPTTIVLPQESALSWSCEYANSCSIDNGIGAANPTGGSKNVRPQGTTVYTLTCSGLDGSRTFPATVSISSKVKIREVLP